LDLRNAEAHLDNDQLDLHNDNLELQIAELEGHSTVPARSRISKDESNLSADKMYLGLMGDARAFGPSKHVRDAQNDAATAHTRLSVATNWLSRDERFMYFSVAFLVLAGFAFGFAAKQTANAEKP
jgi:hypothetical protein